MLKNAYNQMIRWSESCFPRSGGTILRYLALVQPSLFFPQIPYKSSKIRSNLNLLILGPPGIAKSAILKLYQKYAYRPVSIKRGSAAGLEDYLESGSILPGSLCCDDMAIVMSDKKLIKLLEGIISEGRVDTILATRVKKFDVNMAFVGAGVISDLTSFIGGGVGYLELLLLWFFIQKKNKMRLGSILQLT